MALDAIFAAVQPIILANLVGASIVPSFGSTGKDRYAEDAPPRVVFTPVNEDFQPPRGQGGDQVSPRNTLPGNAQPPLYTRVCNVETDIWGDTRANVEVMIDAVVSAVHDALSNGSYGIAGARWLLPEESQKDGEVYRLTFQFMVPVRRVRPQEAIATITAIPETPHIGVPNG